MDLQTVKRRFGIIGRSVLLDRALQTAILVAPTDLTVFIHGESGVGKESFSKIIHALSSRKHQGFIAVNCGAIPEGTINSELFGHAKGGFTGAVSDRKGYFETVNGGTIFLDEIGEMPLQTQQYLLRVLEQGEYMKVGSSQVEKTNVRVVAATNVDLREKVRQGKFREDLYYRLHTVPITVPPLRERSEDIEPLFRKFAGDFAQRYHTSPVRLSDEAQVMLEQYPFPGNIRELKNIAEQISVLAPEKFVEAEVLLNFLPQDHRFQAHLPVPLGQVSSERNPSSSQQTGYYEREILFKFLYDMKRDLNDLKSLVAELARTNNLRMPNHLAGDVVSRPSSLLPPTLVYPEMETDNNTTAFSFEETLVEPSPFTKEIALPNHHQSIKEVESSQETFSIDDMEKDLILKALRKFRGRRKEAAKELGISERTLYRKIKQYDIEA